MSDILSELRARAARNSRRIVYPEGDDPRVLRAVESMVSSGLVQPLLVGNPDAIQRKAEEIGVRLSKIPIIDPGDKAAVERYAKILIPEWRSRGVTELDSQKRLENALYFAAAMVRTGDADGFVGGAANTTGDTVRAAVHCIGVRPASSVVSSFFLMVFPNEKVGVRGGLIFADCAVVPVPTVPQLATIALDAAANASIFLQTDPRVAFLSFSTKGSSSHASVSRIREAMETAKARNSKVLFDGELQVDAALVAEIAAVKAPSSPLKGQANTLIFPDLQSGNIAYKLAERLAGARAIGPILQGLAKPANDLSRGCSVEDIIDVSVVTALQVELEIKSGSRGT